MKTILLSLLLVSTCAVAQETTQPPPPSEPPSPQAPPAVPDASAMPAEEVDCSHPIDTSKMSADGRRHVKEVCAKAGRKEPTAAGELKKSPDR